VGDPSARFSRCRCREEDELHDAKSSGSTTTIIDQHGLLAKTYDGILGWSRVYMLN
jgi:hypothetical protein